jgi:ATP-dependent exoDNAse (exonuclease V) beta subunit
MSSDPRPRLEAVHDSDVKARARAVAELQSFVVQAPAGSGKTELLIQRYLRLLATVDEPESVVAITFTRKAAGEMRARVLTALHEAASGGEPEQPHKRERYKLAQSVLARDGQMGWNLPQNPSRLRILTIDALCGSIVRLMPWTSELGVPSEITEDARELYKAAAHRTVQLIGEPGKAAEHVRRALEHLDNSVPQFEDLLASMLQRRDQWLRHMPQGDTRELRQEMEATLRRYVCERLKCVRDAIPEQARVMMTQLARIAAENLFHEDPDHPIVNCRNLEAFPECSADVLPMWSGIRALVLTNSGGWRAERGIDKRAGFPTSHRREKQLLAALIEQLREVNDLREQIDNIDELPPAEFTDSQWAILESFAQLLPLAVQELRAIFIQEQTCDFSAVAQAAQRALGDRSSPSDLALALGYDIRHLLVDEFQDTSISQVRLLETLMSGWKPEDGRTVFLVGDPMQSIYRFRQAEVGSFLQVAADKKFGQGPIEPLRLKKNFRSRQGIVDWANGTFPQVFPATQNIASSAIVFERCESAAEDRAEPACIQVHAQFGTSEEAAEQEAQEVVALVRRLRERGEKVAILVRGRNHLFRVVPKLRDAAEFDPALRFQAVEIETLAERSVISDLRALTNALLHLGHRVAWLAVLRAPWCGLSLNDLHALCGDGRAGTIWELLVQRLGELSTEGQQQVQRILPVLTEALGKRGRLVLRHWIEATWMSLNGPACVRERRDLEDASSFFELLDELDCGSDLESLSKLEDSISRLFAQPDPSATDAVQIMTIHKAKGLEFNAVILPGLGRSTGTTERKLLEWDERSSAHGSELLMAAMPEKGGEDPIYKFLQRVESEREQNELRRLLYVAATRAKHELHLSGHTASTAQEFLQSPKAPKKGTFLSLLWPGVEADFRQQAERIASGSQNVGQLAAVAGPAAQKLLRRLPPDWEAPRLPHSVSWTPANDPEPAAPEDAVTYDWASEKAKRVGTVVHAVLQRIAEEGLAEWSEQRVRAIRNTLRAALVNAGVSSSDLDDALTRAEKAILQTLADDLGRWILSAHPEAQNEYALTGIDGNELYSIAVDRTFVIDGVRWIIDYKTSSHEGGNTETFLDNEKIRYQDKMERYARILKAQDPRPAKLGLYFPLIRGWRKWDPGSGN